MRKEEKALRSMDQASAAKSRLGRSRGAIQWGATTVAVAGVVWLVFFFWPRRLPPHVAQPLFKPEIIAEGVRVVCPRLVVVGRLGEFSDELFAWLMFDHLRSRDAFREKQVMLISEEVTGKPRYSIYVRLQPDLEKAIGTLVVLMRQSPDPTPEWMCVTPATIREWTQETKLFIDAYTGPAKRILEHMNPADLQRYIRRFIRFKSVTDPRIRRQMEPVPLPLTRGEASRLAGDIIAVTRFYDLPIDIFLGIGAMENNYMDVAGDLRNSTWKHAAGKGDIVLRRRRGRVLIRNDSQGVWQITRESLRYAHSLYLADKRDYTLLPERLRPPRVLNVDDVGPELLTTYAGLLLRNLIDRFHGDITLATGAYNGGPGAPNSHYSAGVQLVATYARNVIERSAAIQISTSNAGPSGKR